MSQPLYLKYRPSKLSEVVGQNLLVKTLTGSIENNKLAHAYLLTGPRGCGKTSTARIIAKSLNCKEGMSISPCGICDNCKEIAASISPDVIEIDAASHRKVEDADGLIEKAYIPPQTGKYKIYILDEVHMLTNHAFNALLKIIEEPPANVIFIFATTEEHKVLPTIVSRCQRFSLKPIDNDSMLTRLEEVAQKESINISDEALIRIVKMSRGGMRDALSFLDQISVLSHQGEEITEDTVNDLFGGISEELMDQLLKGLFEQDFPLTLETINIILQSGKDPIQVMRNLIEYSTEKMELVIKEGYGSAQRLIEIIEIFFEMENSLRQSVESSLKFKAGLLSICEKASSFGKETINLPQSSQQPTAKPAPVAIAKPKVQEKGQSPPEEQEAEKESEILETTSESVEDTPGQKELRAPIEVSHAQSGTESPFGDSESSGDMDELINQFSSPLLKSLIRQAELSIEDEGAGEIVFGLRKDKEKGFLTKIESKRSIIEETIGKAFTVKITEARIASLSAKEEKLNIIKEDLSSESNTDLAPTAEPVVSEVEKTTEMSNNNVAAPVTQPINNNDDEMISAAKQYLGATVISE